MTLTVGGFLAIVVGMLAAGMLLLYLLAHLAGRREERQARKHAAEQQGDAPQPAP
ncbi:MAG: hypothetical protein OXU62_00425 [Gammaproteobacteria bacterium]|nr:hypothetical protein [Gammaproteobacteria bacterium]